jgi:type IV pilus assembly protein PilC
MTLFHYKIISAQGVPSEADVEAKDKATLFHSLKKDGMTIISLEEAKKSFLNMNITIFSGVNAHDKIMFARNLGSMIGAGLPITRGLSIMERQSKGKLKEVLISLNESLSKGVTLSESMSKYPRVFSDLFISMVKAGEESGNLATALKNVALQMEKTYLLGKKIKGAMMYPAVIFCLMIVIGVLMMVFMVPTLTATFTGLGVQLPLSTRIVIAISDFLRNDYLIAILGLAVVIFLGVLAFRTKTGQRVVDFVSIHFPIIGEMVVQVNAARTTRTLSSLLSSGVDIVVAIGVTKQVIQNSYYRDVLDEIQSTIQKGDQISTIFLSHDTLYPLFVGEMVSVGEETGKIGEMLLSVAEFYEEEVDQKTKDMSSVIEPLLMIVIGTAVGFFALAMLTPTYSLANSL